MCSVYCVNHVTGLHPYSLVGRARLELATNGLKEVVALRSPIYILSLRVAKTTVRLSVRLKSNLGNRIIFFLS